MTWTPRAVVTRLALACLAIVTLAASSLRAQSATPAPVGARVRVVLPDSLRPAPFAPRTRALVGTVARLTADTMYLQVTSTDTVRVARTAIRQLAVSQGASPRRSAAEQGIAAALVFGLASYAGSDRRGAVRYQQAFGLAAVGLAAGAALGALRPYEHWRRVAR